MPGDVEPAAAAHDVRRDDAGSRYVLRVDGEEVGIAEFRRRGDQVVFTHTEVDEARTGQGWATTLVAEALADVRDGGHRIVPLCPFVAAYLREHHEFDHLVDRPRRGPAA